MEFVLAIGCLAGLFWLAVVFLRGGLIGGALAVLLAGSCFGHPFFNLPAGPLPLTIDRLLLAVLLMQYCVYRRWGWTDPKPLATADYLLAAFLIVLVASTFAHDFRYRNSQPLSQLVFFYLMPAAMYWVARQTQWTRRGAWLVFTSLGVFGMYLCLTAIAETYQAWEFVFPRYIASPDFHEFLGRGRGPFLNPAANGIVQGLGLCATLLWWPRLNRPGKLLLMAALPVFAWGVFCTYTRSAWMGAGVGLLVMIGLTTPRGWRAAAVGSIAVGSVLALAGSWEHLVTFKRDTYLSAEDAAESARLRPILAVVAWHMFLDRPLVGCGYGQYIQESPAYLADRTTDLPLEKARPYVQHNVFLALLTETGLVGMGLFIALVTSWTRTAWRLWRGGLAPMWVRQMGLLFVALMGVYLPNAMFQDVSIIPMINMLLFFFAGAIVGLAPRLTAIAPHEHLRVWVPDDELLVVSG